MKTPFERLRSLISSLPAAKIDALLITKPTNWYYLTGFSGESGALVVSRKGSTLVTDGRFIAQGRGETSGVRIHEQKGALFESVGQFLQVTHSRRVVLEPSQVPVGHVQRHGKAAGTLV